MVVNGGNWSNGANAGLFNLNLNNAASNSNTNIGGRLANEHGQKSACPQGHRPAPFIRDHHPLPVGEEDRTGGCGK